MGFESARLKEIRIIKGYTVEELAQYLGMSKQALSKHENGDVSPDADFLNKLVERFSLPISYFTKPILTDEKTPLFYRRNKRTPQKEIDNVQLKVRWIYEIILSASRVRSLYVEDVPQLPLELSIEEKAQKLREIWGIGNSPIEDMAAILEQHGFYIFSLELRSRKVDGCSQQIGRYPIIILNSNKGSLACKNFSLAHELGHLVLHANGADLSQDEMDDQANMFAGCFLLPKTPLERELIKINISTFIRIGNNWNVSPHVVVERISTLGFFGDNEDDIKKKKSSFNTRLNRIVTEYCTATPVNICSLKCILEEIDKDEKAYQEFIYDICFPIDEIEKLCHVELHGSIGDNHKNSNIADEIEGIQYTLIF